MEREGPPRSASAYLFMLLKQQSPIIQSPGGNKKGDNMPYEKEKNWLCNAAASDLFEDLLSQMKHTGE